METAYIGIGSNMGDPSGNCLDAIDRIGRIDNCRIISVSGLYLTEPVGDSEQEWYTNCVAAISTELTARDLLKRLLGIEADMGRVRRKRWESRLIDLDLLLYGEEIIKMQDLEIPHPRIHVRKFVLIPLSDLDSGLIHPTLGISIQKILDELDDETQDISKL